MKTCMRSSFFSNFKKLTLVILFSFKFSSKSVWLRSGSLKLLKLGSYSLQLCKKNWRVLDFWVFLKQLLLRGVFKPVRLLGLRVFQKQLMSLITSHILMSLNTFNKSDIDAPFQTFEWVLISPLHNQPFKRLHLLRSFVKNL